MKGPVRVDWDANSGLKLLGLSVDGSVVMSLCMGASIHVAVELPRSSLPLVDRIRRLAGAERWDGVDLVRLSLHDNALWWSIMHSDSSWNSTDPRWRSGSFHPIDFVFGEAVHSKVIREETDVVVALPERTYRWTVKLVRRTYRRPRAPAWSANVVDCYEAEAKEGEQIPIPGKGENPWDCGPDAMFSLSGPGSTIGSALGDVVRSVTDRRIRYGWKEA